MSGIELILKIKISTASVAVSSEISYSASKA